MGDVECTTKVSVSWNNKPHDGRDLYLKLVLKQGFFKQYLDWAAKLVFNRCMKVAPQKKVLLFYLRSREHLSTKEQASPCSISLFSYQNNTRALMLLGDLYRIWRLYQCWRGKKKENKIIVWGDANDILGASSPMFLWGSWQLMVGLNKKTSNLWLLAQSNHLSLFQLHG